MNVLKLGTVKFEALQYRVKVVVTDNVGEYGCSIGCCSHSEMGNRSPEATHFGGDHESILAFHPFPSPGTIAHESWHAVRNMLLSVQAELDNEVVAYHLSHLVDAVSEKLHAHIHEMGELDFCPCPRCSEKAAEETKATKQKRKKSERNRVDTGVRSAGQ